jgi:hypothetical protein
MKGSRLPENWKPDGEFWSFAARLGLTGEQIAKVGEDFADYWHDQPGRYGVKVTWLGTWRRWVRKEADKLNRNNRGDRSVYDLQNDLEKGPR